MPDYLYECPNHGEFEITHSIRDDAMLKECEMCRKENDISTPVKRLINGRTGGVVELTGQEYAAKIKADAQAYKKEVYSSERLFSNILGEGKYQAAQQRIDRNKR